MSSPFIIFYESDVLEYLIHESNKMVLHIKTSYSKVMLLVIIFVSFSLFISSSTSITSDTSSTRSTESTDVDLKNITKDTNIFLLWELFKSTYNKEYATDEEIKKRFDIFADNVKKITEHNEEYDKGLSTYKMGLNAFSDYTAEEFRKFRGLSTLG